MSEHWLPVVGWEGLYEISDEGQVRSLGRTVQRRNGRPMKIQEKLLTAQRVPPGDYLGVVLRKVGQKPRLRRLHTLVLEAFTGPRPPGMVACHNNGQKDDLRPANLRWDSQSGNMFDAVHHGANHNANKTACKRGHDFTAANTYLNRHGDRQCRRCVQEARGTKKPYGPRK